MIGVEYAFSWVSFCLFFLYFSNVLSDINDSLTRHLKSFLSHQSQQPYEQKVVRCDVTTVSKQQDIHAMLYLVSSGESKKGNMIFPSLSDKDQDIRILKLDTHILRNGSASIQFKVMAQKVEARFRYSRHLPESQA